jgi:NAD(P)-dependent dehydrogenase (short-subunit alcohol dehydrogenase family)
MSTALVIGGTGPTGIHVVRGLVERGYDVTILHRGTHERPETPPEVRHLHADPYDADALAGVLDGMRVDVVLAMYGRLRRIAELTVGVTDRFVSVGGVPAIRGWMNPWLFDPDGLPVPVGERAPTVAASPAPRRWCCATTRRRLTSATRTPTARSRWCPGSGASCGASSTAGGASWCPTTG